MGICHSSCANGSNLEYYDAWRHKSIRRPFISNDCYPKNNTKLWMCKRGCCAIRWKLDYAEFQNYFKYVEMSPYVVLQDKTRQCDCIMCRGLANTTSVFQRRWKVNNSATDGSLTEDEPERLVSP